MKSYIIQLFINGKQQNVEPRIFDNRKEAWNAMFRWAAKQIEVGMFLYRKKGFGLSGKDGYIKVENGNRVFEYKLKTNKKENK